MLPQEAKKHWIDDIKQWTKAVRLQSLV